jgi:23S rRNA pseudouridine1911/1915/1917 synthase
MPQHRSLPVPDGLAGNRVDVAIAKLLGFSRTFAGEVIERGGVTIDGRLATKSDRLTLDATLSVEWDDPREPEIVPVVISDMQIVYDDDDIVVVSKPPFLAAHPSLGWDRVPNLNVGAARAAGHRSSFGRWNIGSHDCCQERCRLFGDEAQVQRS